jgi:hypothetical protein
LSRERTIRTNRREALLIGLAFAVLLVALAYWRAISAYRAPYRILTDQPIPAWIDQLYTYRWGVRGAMLAAGASLIFLEARSAAVTRIFRGWFSRRATALGVVVVLALSGRSYLMAPGRMALIDGLNNMASIITVRAALVQGHWPPYFWSNYAWMGFPWLQFHNSLFYYEGGLIDLVLRDAYLSMKLALLANHGLAACAMYLYVRRLARSDWAGLVAAAAWATTFFHYHYFVHVGSVHLSLLIPFLPAALLCVEDVVDGRRGRHAAAGLALCLSLMLWDHGYYGAVSAGLILIYGAARLLLARQPLGRRLGRLGYVAAGIGLGSLGALSQWLPPLVERDLVGQWNRGLRYIQTDIGLEQVLSFRQSFLTPDYWGGYVGQTVAGLALLGVVLALLTRDRKIVGLILWLLVSAYLSLGHRYLPYDEIFSRIPFGEFVYAVRYPGKYLLFAEFSLAALVGVCLKQIARLLYLLRRAVRRLPFRLFLLNRRLALVLASAIAGEMIFLTLQVNSLYPETWLATEPGHQEAYDWLRANGDGVSRVLDKSYSHMEVSALTGQPSFFSHIEESPASSMMYYWLANDSVGEALADGEMGAATRDGLYMLDVGYLMIADPPPPDSGWQPGYQGTPFSVWQVPAHSPALAAPALRTVSSTDESIDEMIEAMGLDYVANSAEHIPVAASPLTLRPAGLEQLESGEGPVKLSLVRYEVGLDSVILEYELSRPAYVQLSYSAYPYLLAYLDGRQQSYFWTAFNFVGFASPAGAHRVELRPALSPLRVVSHWLDALGLLAIAALWLFGVRRER